MLFVALSKVATKVADNLPEIFNKLASLALAVMALYRALEAKSST